MRYENITEGIFLKRPNRFIAHVEIDKRVEVCHVKNTGRCRELLVPGTPVFLEKSSNPNRKTQNDLIAVKKGNRLINMDSQIPNKVVEEWLLKGNLFGEGAVVKREVTYGNSRFDLYIETPDKKCFMEIKGVTLEEDGVVRFPDAPTQKRCQACEGIVQVYRGRIPGIYYVCDTDGGCSVFLNRMRQPTRSLGKPSEKPKRRGFIFLPMPAM